MDKFQLVSDYKLSGDQPEAVDALVKGIESGMREQTLMGVLVPARPLLWQTLLLG